MRIGELKETLHILRNSYDEGKITEVEYQRKRAKVLSQWKGFGKWDVGRYVKDSVNSEGDEFSRTEKEYQKMVESIVRKGNTGSASVQVRPRHRSAFEQVAQSAMFDPARSITSSTLPSVPPRPPKKVVAAPPPPPALSFNWGLVLPHCTFDDILAFRATCKRFLSAGNNVLKRKLELTSLPKRSTELSPSILKVAFDLMPNLQRLSLSMCPKLHTLSPIQFIPRLSFLDLNKVGIQSADGICLPSLTRVRISHCPELVNCSALSFCPNMTHLIITHCPALQDISFVSNCQSLISLDLAHCDSVSDLSPMSNCSRQLSTLGLAHCTSLSIFSPLASVLMLESLNLEGCEISDIGILPRLSHLRALNLSHCQQLEEIDSISFLENLKWLSLRNCEKLKSIKGLSGTRELTFLSLSGCNSLVDIRPLKGLEKLVTVEVIGCFCVDFVSKDVIPKLVM